jgi:hypothetical protein
MPPCTEWRPHRKKSFAETSAYPCFAGKKCCRLLITAGPSVHAIYVETLGLSKR